MEIEKTKSANGRRESKPVPQGGTEAGRYGYKELAERLNQHGLEETETSITGKLRARHVRSVFFPRMSGSFGARWHKIGGNIVSGPIPNAY